MNAQTALRMVASLTLAIGLGSQAHAYSGCTNNSLNGSYGFQFNGAITPGLAVGVGGAAEPLAVQHQMLAELPGTANVVTGFARLFLDGGGNLFGDAVLSINGVWSEGPLTGTYAVNDDCTAAFTLTDASGDVQHFDGVVVSRGSRAVLRQSDQAIAVSGLLVQGRNSCQPTDIYGNFGLRTSGSLQGASPITSIGGIVLNPDGTVKASESQFNNGVSVQVASTGAITVNPDCTVTLSLASNADGSLATYRGMIVNNLTELMLVRSDPGMTVTGNMVQQ